MLGAALLLALLAMVASSGPVSLLTAPRDTAGSTAPASVSAGSAPSASAGPTTPPPDSSAGSVEGILLTIIKTMLLILAFVVLFVLSRVFTRHRSRPKVEPPVAPIVPLPDLPDAVRRDAEDQFAALLRGRPRNAIVACWLRLEGSVAEVGLPRTRSETSVEYTERILARFAVDRPAIAELAALYREARFSTHDLDEGARQRAVDALRAVHDSLGRVRP